MINSADYPVDYNYKLYVYSALLAANGRSIKNEICSLALMTRNRKKALAFTREKSNVACLLTRALILTDQLDFVENHSPNDVDNIEGVRILSDLQQRFPENGIYTFFKIATYGQDSERAEKAFNEFIKFKKIEFPMLLLYDSIRQLGQLNGTAWLKTIEVTSGLNTPNYSKGLKVVYEILEKQNSSPELDTWIENFHAYMEKIDTLNLAEPAISLQEVSAFRSIGVNYFNKYSPLRKAPGFYNQEDFIPYFRRRVQYPTSYADFLTGDEKCNDMLKKLNTYHPFYLSHQKDVGESLSEPQD